MWLYWENLQVFSRVPSCVYDERAITDLDLFGFLCWINWWLLPNLDGFTVYPTLQQTAHQKGHPRPHRSLNPGLWVSILILSIRHLWTQMEGKGDKGLQINGKLSRFLSAAPCHCVCARSSTKTHASLISIDSVAKWQSFLHRGGCECIMMHRA